MEYKFKNLRHGFLISFVKKITIVDLRTFSTTKYRNISDVPEEYDELFVYETYQYDSKNNIVPEFPTHEKIILNDKNPDDCIRTADNFKIGDIFQYRIEDKIRFHQLIHIYSDDNEKIKKVLDLIDLDKTKNKNNESHDYFPSRVLEPEYIQRRVDHLSSFYRQTFIQLDKCYDDYIFSTNGDIYQLYNNKIITK